MKEGQAGLVLSSCHFTCILPVLHHDVARNREKLVTCSPYCIKNRLTWSLATSTMPHGDVDQVMNSGATALLRRSLPTRTCRFRKSLQHCGVPGEWYDVCSFIKPPGSETEWHIRMHGAFEIPHETLGIKPTDQSCHHEAWVHISCMSTHGWLIALLEPGNIGGQSSGKETVRTTTSRITWPSTQENHVAIRVRKT